MRALLYIVLFALQFPLSANSFKVIPGHSHNDYEQDIPLETALENGFMSIEVDVHLHNGKLIVSHDRPSSEALTPDIEELYLTPLKEHIDSNSGAVYPGYDGHFFLMIDFKTEADATYDALKNILTKFNKYLTRLEHENYVKGPVTVFISGNRPLNRLAASDTLLAFLDGRPEELNLNVPAQIMPVVSDNYSNFLKWRGIGKPSNSDLKALHEFIQTANAQNKLIRLWAAPDNPQSWRFQLDNGIGLVNTDKIKEFREFYLDYLMN